MKRYLNRCRGISLIELIVTLAIIAIATSIVLPSLGSAYDRIRLRSFSQDLVREMRAVRAASQTDGRIRSVVLGEDGGVIRAGGTIEERISYSDGIAVMADSGGVLLLFLPSGQITGNRTIQMRNQSGHTTELEVDTLSGRIQVAGSVQP